jgi:purine-nucleoside phosphorylase
MSKEIQAATDFIMERLDTLPEIGLITGTGLGNLTRGIKPEMKVPYGEIPHFPLSTAEGHRGVLVSGKLAGRTVIAMEGRFHIYEGYTPREITFPIRVMSKLGVKYLLISSAAGGLNPDFKAGDLMLVTDHINMTGKNPLIGPNLEGFGPRFPDMSSVYNPELRAMALKKARDREIYLQKGVYIGVIGPSLETPSETRFYRMIGGDAIGMSTVNEAITAVHCGMKIIAIVVITNVNLPDSMNGTSIEEIISASGSASHLLSLLWEDIINELPGQRNK